MGVSTGKAPNFQVVLGPADIGGNVLPVAGEVYRSSAGMASTMKTEGRTRGPRLGQTLCLTLWIGLTWLGWVISIIMNWVL